MYPEVRQPIFTPEKIVFSRASYNNMRLLIPTIDGFILFALDPKQKTDRFYTDHADLVKLIDLSIIHEFHIVAKTNYEEATITFFSIAKNIINPEGISLKIKDLLRK